MSRRPAAPPEPDRRALAVLALLLLAALGGGAALYRRGEPRPQPQSGLETARLPPPDVRPLSAARPAPAPASLPSFEPREVEVTVAQFLGILAKRNRTPATERFLDAFAARPALRRALRDFSRAAGDRAPARQLVRVMSARPEFRELLSEFRDDPGFRAAAADAAKDPRVARALGGYASVGSSGEIELSDLPAAEAGRAGAPGRTGAGAHEVEARLAGITRDVGERAAGAYLPSMFAGMPREERERLEDACDRYGFCDPVSACRIAELWASCVAACRSGGKCPPELLDEEEPDVPIVVPDGF